MYTGLVGALKTENAFGEFTDIAYISGWSVDEKARSEERRVGKECM